MLQLNDIQSDLISTLAMLHETNLPALARDGFTFVPARQMRKVLGQAGQRDWQSFASSWDDLGLDTYMADGGRYRRRRYAAFLVSAEGVKRKPHQPHYQSLDHNPLNGGVERWFQPITDHVASHPSLLAVLRTCHTVFDRTTPSEMRPPSWHVEVHQFRIEASAGAAGRPTPEGLHRDGVDWVAVMLVKRRNIAGGMTTIHDSAKQQVAAFTLAEPMDMVFLNDARVFHGVTEVTPEQPSSSPSPAYRDVLVVTFRR